MFFELKIIKTDRRGADDVFSFIASATLKVVLISPLSLYLIITIKISLLEARAR